jgi:hypothetical protein
VTLPLILLTGAATVAPGQPGTGGGTGGTTTPPPGSGGTAGSPGTGNTTPPSVPSPWQLSFVDTDGTVWPFAPDLGTTELDGALNLLAPPWSISEDTVASRDGALVRGVRAGVREVTIPLLFQRDTEPLLRAAMRSWVRRVNPANGFGALRIFYADGTGRELSQVLYSTGLQGNKGSDVYGRWWQKAALVFRAYDPYWQDITDTALTVAGGTQTPFFPLLPLHLSIGGIGTAKVIDNDGDADAWPVWTLTGPGTGLTIANGTTGKTLSAPSLSWASGHSITIDTRPGAKSVTLDDGTNLFANLDAASELWPLVPGAQAITVTVGGSSSSTVVTLRYRRRWLTA